MAENNKIYYTSKYSGEDIDKALEYYYGIQDLEWLVPKKDQAGNIITDKDGNVVYEIEPQLLITEFNEINGKLRQIVAWINNAIDVDNLTDETVFEGAEDENGVIIPWYKCNNFIVTEDVNKINNRWVGAKNNEILVHTEQIGDNAAAIQALNNKFSIDNSSLVVTENDGIVSQNTKNIQINTNNIDSIKITIGTVKEEEEEGGEIHKYGSEGSIYGLLYDTKATKKDENENDVTVVEDGILTNIQSAFNHLDELESTKDSLIATNDQHAKNLEAHSINIENLQNRIAVVDGGSIQKEDGTSEEIDGFLNREKFKQISIKNNEKNEPFFYSFDWINGENTDRESLYSILLAFDQTIGNILAYVNPDSELLDVNVTNIVEP